MDKRKEANLLVKQKITSSLFLLMQKKVCQIFILQRLFKMRVWRACLFTGIMRQKRMC